jgi:hypothetical protein
MSSYACYAFVSCILQLDGNTAAEKKKGLDIRTYLLIRKDPNRASAQLTKELTFDDLVVSHTCHLMHVMHLCHAFCDLMVQEWDESYHYLVPIPDELETYMEAMPFLRMCNCTQFWHYARCVHVLMYTIMNLGRGCVPRGEDIRLVAPRAGRGTHTCIYS